MNRFFLAVASALGLATSALAGGQYVDSTGFAVSGYDVVAYRSLPQSSVGEPQSAAIPGRTSITAEYNGAVFAFSTEENRDRFLTDPAFFVPRYDGHCAYGVSKGGKVPGNPDLWRIVDDRLYLNITEKVVEFWEEDIAGHIELADGNWVDIEANAASTRKIPAFESLAPLQD